MQLTRSSRWSLAFADLSLLMLGFMVLQALNTDVPSVSTPVQEKNTNQREKFEWNAGDIFEEGEAMISEQGRARIIMLAEKLVGRNHSLAISIVGKGPASARLDSWEMSAARMASVGRALRAEGVESRQIKFGKIEGETEVETQKLLIVLQYQ
jgi:hypothetical protein